MTEPISDLYSRKILAYAASIPRLGHLEEPHASADAVSRLCGSKVHVEIRVEDGRIADFAQQVQACALGQTAASIIGGAIIGATREEIEQGRREMRQMLETGVGASPGGRFAELKVLAPVKDYPGRHGSVMLVFDALHKAFATLEPEAAS